MKKNISILIIFVVTALFLNTGCSSKMLETKSVWPGKNINIDGSIDEWEEIPVISDDDDNTFNFKLCNDNDYLYTAFYSKDINLGGQIKMTGVKLWVDSTGGKNKKRGLLFRGGPEFSEMRDLIPSEGSFEGKEMEFPGGDRSIERDNFAIINSEGDADPISKEGFNGPAIEYGISNGTLIYELKIPLRFKGLESFAIRANPGDEISFCLEIQGGGKPESMRGGHMPEGRPPGGGDMPGGGMPPPGGGGPPRGGRPPEGSQKEEFWIKIILASK